MTWSANELLVGWLTGVAVVSGLAVRLVRGLALKNALLDIPNERSSHTLPVPRLGGAAFVPVVLLATSWAGKMEGLSVGLLVTFLGGAITLWVVSLIDDFVALSAGIRFAVQFAVAGGVLVVIYTFWPLAAGPGSNLLASVFRPPSSGFWLLAFWIVGVLNIYNFMDGIDGIAGLQAFVGGLAWCMFGTILSAPWTAVLGASLAGSALGFLTLNWPPAKIFMGDAGSTVLGYCFAVIPLLLVVEARAAEQLEALLVAGGLVVWPFLADGVFTILRRLKNRERIFHAHRSHLYQRLVIAGVSHRRVSSVYGGLAVLGAFLAWRVVRDAPYSGLMSAIAIPIAFGLLWCWVICKEKRP